MAEKEGIKGRREIVIGFAEIIEGWLDENGMKSVSDMTLFELADNIYESYPKKCQCQYCDCENNMIICDSCIQGDHWDKQDKVRE